MHIDIQNDAEAQTDVLWIHFSEEARAAGRRASLMRALLFLWSGGGWVGVGGWGDLQPRRFVSIVSGSF